MTENTIMNNENKNIIDLEYFKKLVYNLNVKRSNDYDNWKLVVWGISNVSRDNKWSLEIRNEIIHEFSKKSEKYDKSKVDFFIDNNIKDIKDGINVGSIVEWYRIDNNIIKENKNIVNTINEIGTINIISTINEISLNYILNNRLRDYDIAKYIKNKLGTNYVCSDIKNNLWYYFENPLWYEDLEGVKISNKISEDIPKEAEINIKNLNNEITNILTNDDLQEDEKTDAVNKRKTNIKKLNVFIDKCKNNSSKKSIRSIHALLNAIPEINNLENEQSSESKKQYFNALDPEKKEAIWYILELARLEHDNLNFRRLPENGRLWLDARPPLERADAIDSIDKKSQLLQPLLDLSKAIQPTPPFERFLKTTAGLMAHLSDQDRKSLDRALFDCVHLQTGR
jgi:hypothetical protein